MNPSSTALRSAPCGRVYLAPRDTVRPYDVYVIMVGDGASDVPRITTEKRREQAFKCRKRHVSPLRGSVPLPYGWETMQIVGAGFPAPLCGVLPMVALTPKGVRYPGLSAFSPSVMPLQILRYAQG